MRILYWSSFYWPQLGGLETIGEQLVRELAGRGHELLVVTSHGYLALPDRDEHDGVPIRRFDFWRAIEKRDPVALLLLQRDVAKLKAEFNADIVHINCSDPSVLFHTRTQQACRVPYVFTTHGHILPEFLTRDSLLGTALRDADWVTAVADHQLSDICTAIPEVRARSSVIYNGLAAPAIQPTLIATGNQRILCIGRIVPDKGFDVAVAAFTLIAARCPDARLVIAGVGPDSEAIKRQVCDAGLDARVDFLGGVDHREVPQLMSDVAVVLMPSRAEPFGLVAVEAGQMARPVVATDVGGLSEIVVDGETGYLLPNCDFQGLAGAVLRLLQNPELADRMGRKGLDRARSLYGVQRHTDEFEALFQRITEESKHVGAH